MMLYMVEKRSGCQAPVALAGTVTFIICNGNCAYSDLSCIVVSRRPSNRHNFFTMSYLHCQHRASRLPNTKAVELITFINAS